MRQVIRERRLVADDWVYAGKDESAGEGTVAHRIALPLPDYLATRTGAAAALAAAGVWLAPTDDVATLLPYLKDLRLIAVDFPTTGDGRGYSQARLLRDRHGYKGELRAIGAVRVDQMYFLARCGFDVFELAAGEDADVAIAQLQRFSVAYQDSTGALVHPRRRYDAGATSG
jgi:uncharacterized protein (DUF934 family)